MLTIQIQDLLDLSKYTDIYKSDIKVYTPNGLKKVYDVDITAYNSETLSISTRKNELMCAPDHKIKSNDWVKSNDLKIDDFIDTKYGMCKITKISKEVKRYDLLDLHVDGNEYYTNDILSHNSSLLDSFDFTLFGKVRGKKKKWATLSTLPNRINNELFNRVVFKSNGIDIEVKRGVSPSKLELWENGVLNEKAGKGNIDNKIEDYIGLDIETFKSFISMSINDFKNFISLTNEEKKLLLDKLFNLEVINLLNTILKDINKNNKVKLSNLDSEISTFDDSIDSIRRSIDKALLKQKLNIQQEIDDIIKEVNSQKDKYRLLKEKVQKIRDKEDILTNELDKEKKQLSTIQNEVRNTNKELKLYDMGKCPTCATDFHTEHFNNLRVTLVEKKQKYDDLLDEIEENISNVKSKQIKLKGIAKKTDSAFNDMTYLLKGYKAKVSELKLKQTRESGKDNINTVEFEETILELSSKKETSKVTKVLHKEKELYYKELNRIFGEEGVKKSIIAGIIKPINHFISENVSKMNLPFDVKLNETFSAEIKSLGNVIEHDTLSTGETKLINISILVAYLKLIRTKKHINVLFLDEVFSSIDINNINHILNLLKSFANEYKINIFVVHHAILNQEMFDRIIRIEKGIFSDIIEIKIEN